MHAGTDWQDAWVYKWIEAAAVCWAMTEDSALDRLMDETIAIVVQAQQPDGYIATQTTVRGRERFQNPAHHELYTMGHLLTAACIHHRLTGKTALLEVAIKVADYVYGTFKGRDPELAHFPHNPSIIMGGVCAVHQGLFIRQDGPLWVGQRGHEAAGHPYERFQPGDPERRRSHICCPTNLLRTVAEWHNYQYTTSDEGLWVHHYAANTLATGPWTLTQETDYPWDGTTTFRMETAPTEPTGLMLRILGWADGAMITINGQKIDVPAAPATYARVVRQWSISDVVTLCLPMQPFLIEAHPKVEALRNHVVVRHGPIQYCLESPDLPEGVRVPEVRMSRDAQFTVSHEPESLHGVTVLECQARRIPEGDWTGKLYRPTAETQAAESVTGRLIPYYA